MCSTHRIPSHRRGMAYLMAIFVLTVLSALAMGLCHTAAKDATQTTNYVNSNSARIAAESGLQFFTMHLNDLSGSDLDDDPMTMIEDRLKGALGNQAVSSSGKNLNKVVTVSPMSISDKQQFSAEFYVSATDPDNPSTATEVQMVVTGAAGRASKRLGMAYSVDVNKDILTFATVSSVRQIIRGNNVVINGGIWSTWDRDRVVGPCRYGYDVSWPLDIGNTNSTWRSQENIQINGGISTHMNENDFPQQDWYANGQSLSCQDAIRHTDMWEDVKYHQHADSEEKQRWFKWQNYDTNVYREEAQNRNRNRWQEREQNGYTHVNEDGVLTYPSANAQALLSSTSAEAQQYKSGWTWKRGYQDENQNFVAADPSDPNYYSYERYYSSGGYVKLGSQYVTTPPADPSAPKVICEDWCNGISFWRAYYEGFNGSSDDRPVMRDVIIPMGSHAHFKNCVFEGVTFIEADDQTELSETSAGDLYSKYNKDLSGGVIDGEAGQARNTVSCNNVVFEDCEFRGPVVTSVAKSFRAQQNSLMFVGSTRFDDDAIAQVADGFTILAPNYNVNIGDFNQGDVGSDSVIRGLLVGGIVDIRDNAVVRGTILSMAKLDHVSDYSSWMYGANIGNWENNSETTDDQGFTPSQHIEITVDPDNQLPVAVDAYYKLEPIPGSYVEYGS